MTPLPHITMKAANKAFGMSLIELENATRTARKLELDRIVKVRVGFKGQIQSIEFGSLGLPPVPKLRA